MVELQRCLGIIFWLIKMLLIQEWKFILKLDSIFQTTFWNFHYTDKNIKNGKKKYIY